MRLGWKLPLERLSATSMSKFASCPERFRQRYLVGKKDGMFGARFMGIVDHAVMEQVLTWKKNNTTLTDEDLPALYARQWDATLEEHGEEVIWKETTSAAKEFEIGLKMMKLYVEKVVPELNPVAMEERIEFRVPGVPSKIVGYVDILEHAKIREKKTNGQKVQKPKPDWRFQGLIYMAGLGMPVQWDVVTRQVTPQLYTARECPELWMPLRSPQAIMDLIRDTAWYMNDCFQRFGADNPWPLHGIHGDWTCSYCPIGPKEEGSCALWQTHIPMR